MRHLLNEEVIKMQQLAGLADKDETFDDIVNEWLTTIDEHALLTEEEKLLEEGLWEKTKYYLSKLGRYKANGEIFGKDKIDAEAEKKLSDILQKQGNNRIKILVRNIKKNNPEFPNNEKEQEFLQTALTIAKAYDSIVAATKKKPADKGYMPIDAANVIITDLRELVKDYLDRQLKAAYTVFNEANKIGKYSKYSADDAKDLLSKRRGDTEFDSERIKTLKSKKLPIALLSLGAAAGGLGWIYKMLADSGESVYEWMQSIKDLGSVQDGEGFTQILNRTMDAGLDPNSSVSEVISNVKEIGGGDYDKGVEMLTKQDGIFADPGKAKEALMAMKDENSSESLKDFFKNDLAGTGKTPGDMLVTKAGGVLAQMVLKQTVKQGVKTAVMAPFAKILGVVGVVGAATVALARYKGRKTSRAKVLDDLYQSMKALQPTQQNPSIVAVPNTPSTGIKNNNKTQAGNKNLQAKTAQASSSVKPVTPDGQLVNRDLNRNTSLKTALARIDTADEFRELILQMSQFVSANLKKDKTNLKSALYTIANKLRAKTKNITEDYSLPADTQNTNKAIQATKELVNDLQKINTRDEFVDLILNILPLIDPDGKITKDRKKLINIIYSAANKIDSFIADRDKDPAKKPGGLG
jgi:hypothetical protein